ncbi:MAG: RecQ family ATP-dependent DNA helicase [Chitinophagales bacterium]|nr:RecQ family ATP-dependent DNA helicase [Chitinophagales bacterium]
MQFSSKQVLKKYWGYENFRPLQEEIVLSVLQGNDTLALLPTGGGKSICFQVPALVLDGICIVISPLIALMKDQVFNLKNKGIKAEAIYTGLQIHQIQTILSNCIFGDVKLLYVSPERLATSSFREAMKQMKVNLIAVDEAHCISQWGYDFRPPYLQIAEVRELLPKIPILALTATATPKVAKDIVEKLHFKEPKVFAKSFVRENLSYVVRQTFDKNTQLVHILKNVPGSSVVYVNSRKATKHIATFLIQNGFSADFYHAGLSATERSSKQENWIEGKTRIIVCTNAFGMGIDKPDVRTVIHLETPQSLEAYFQEAGRAGRDGKKAYCVLLINETDKKLLKDIIEHFPLPENLRNTYNLLCNYLKIPLHNKPSSAVNFSVSAFAAENKIPIRDSLVQLKLLEQMEIVSITETSMPFSTVKCLVSKDALMKLYAANPSLEPLTKMILRTSEGVFEDFSVLHEKEILKRLSIDFFEFQSQIKTLQQLRIFNYQPISEEPQITLLHERVDAKHLQLDYDLLKLRKEQIVERAKAMLHYISSVHFCRSNILVSYFGEEIIQKCGVCDVCIAEKKSGLNTKQFESLMKQLETLLVQPKTIQELAETTAQKPEVIVRCLQFLSDAELVKCNAKTGKFEWE